MVQPAVQIASALERRERAGRPTSTPDTARPPYRICKRLLREPFLHFVVLGAVLYGISHYVDERARLMQITITRDQVARIADLYRLQYGAPPSPSQLKELVDRHIDEEILYREALQLGLDREDEIIRRRLVQKYEFLQQDMAPLAEPTEAQLRGYFEGHRLAYRVPEQISFQQVYFSPDQRGESGARDAAEKMAKTLNLRAAKSPANEGDAFPGPATYSASSREELTRVFGEQGLTQEIFAVELSRWSEPLRSGLGWHTVYVTARQPARDAAFEEVREDVRRDYLESDRSRRNAETLAKLRAQFKIVREP